MVTGNEGGRAGQGSQEGPPEGQQLEFFCLVVMNYTCYSPFEKVQGAGETAEG